MVDDLKNMKGRQKNRHIERAFNTSDTFFLLR